MKTKVQLRESEPEKGRLIAVPNGHKLAVRLPAQLILRVEAFAAKNKVDRSTAVRMLLERALKEEQ